MFNHDPNYGDNTTCDLCKDVFDVRNSPHEVIGDKWICDNCCSRLTPEEIAEEFNLPLAHVYQELGLEYK